MSIYHSWRDARDRVHLAIRPSTTSRSATAAGSTATGSRSNATSTPDGRRSTLAHELVHDERRIFPRDPVLHARAELVVERIAARRLIALDRLLDVLRWTRRTDEVAEELWVDVPMLVALVQSLTPAERD